MDAKRIDQIEIATIFADPTFNCRGTAIAPIDVVDLAKDIEAHGLQQPIVVQPYDKYKPEIFKYRVISGHRRYTAFKVLKRETIPCVININLTEAQALVLNLTENLHRKDLNVLQEAKALERLKMAGMSVSEVSKELGKSTTWVSVRYQLLELHEHIQNAAAAGFINQAQIRQLHQLPDMKQQLDAAAKIKKAKSRGEKPPKINPNQKKRNILKAKQRDRDDIFWMQDHIQEFVGNNFGTRCLAWAAGEITDFELFQAIQEEAHQSGKTYNIPYGLGNLA
jgi:ParB/RepB/Spo0J family partition protein